MLRFEIPTIKNKGYFIMLSDIQHGAASSLTKMAKDTINWIANTKNIKVFLGGDLQDNNIPTHMAFTMLEQNRVPHDQLDDLTAWLKPIREKIVGGIHGNHELRSWNAAGLNPTRILCEYLKVPYLGISTEAEIRVGKQTYTAAIHHGSGGSGSKNKFLDNEKLELMYPGNEMYICGHNHFLGEQRMESETHGKLHDVVYVRTGSFQGYADYAHNKMMRRQKPGQAIIKLYSNDHRIDVSTSNRIAE